MSSFWRNLHAVGDELQRRRAGRPPSGRAGSACGHHLEQEDVDEEQRADRDTTTRTTDDLDARSAMPVAATATATGRVRSSVDVPQDEVEAGEDGDDVGDVHAAQQPRHDRDVVERLAVRIFTRNGPRSPLLTM